MADIEQEARALVRDDQVQDNGEFERTAAMWQGILGVPVTKEQMSLCMVARDVSRLVSNPSDHQSMVGSVANLIRYQQIVEPQ